MSSQNVIDILQEEIRVLRKKVKEMEIQLQLTARDPVPPLSRSERAQSVPTEPRAVCKGTPIALRALVQKSSTWAKVVTEGKKRKVEEGTTRGAEEEKKKVGRVPDPEENRGLGLPVMVKVGGVRWDDEIGGVVEGLKEVGFVSCEGGRWLVSEEEREKRMKQGRRSSTVVVRVCGRERVGELCRAGLWVGGVWCTVRKFVVVLVKRKEASWVRVVKKVEESVGGMEMNVKGAVMAMGEKVVGVEKSVAEVAEEQNDRVKLLEERVMEAIGDGMKVLGEGMGLLRKEIMEKVEKMENERLVQTQIKVVPAGPSSYRRR
ncbi:hypothetical protein L873DRAFT_1799967 [Choiromyces venosus 120613-1]|uniref:Uncharacterized protein n=1 Tax=Choiromyces venosus 120613-1 TaxID=1336337 RepID=A0A3N4K112_9PEZI|nr:hypothetical protein L873DRAFT_1799967 [Choiromyces venosus 120613-1]